MAIFDTRLAITGKNTARQLLRGMALGTLALGVTACGGGGDVNGTDAAAHPETEFDLGSGFGNPGIGELPAVAAAGDGPLRRVVDIVTAVAKIDIGHINHNLRLGIG